MPAVAKLDTVRFEIDVPVDVAEDAVIPKVPLLAWPLTVRAAPAPPAMLALGALRTKPTLAWGTLTVTAPPEVVSVTFWGTGMGKVSPVATVEGPMTVTVIANAASFPMTSSARVMVLNAQVAGLPPAMLPLPAVSLPLTGSTVNALLAPAAHLVQVPLAQVAEAPI